MAASSGKHLGCVHMIEGDAYVCMCNSSNSRFLVYHSLLNTLPPWWHTQYLRKTVNVYRYVMAAALQWSPGLHPGAQTVKVRYVMAAALHRSLGLQCERCGVG